MSKWGKSYLRVEEVACFFNRHPKTIRRWIAEEKTPLEVLPGSQPLLILATSITTFQQTGFLKKYRDTRGHGDLD